MVYVSVRQWDVTSNETNVCAFDSALPSSGMNGEIEQLQQCVFSRLKTIGPKGSMHSKEKYIEIIFISVYNLYNFFLGIEYNKQC